MGLLNVWIAGVVLLLAQDAALARVQISSTVRLYVRMNAYKQVCSTALTRARAAGSIAVNINPAHHFVVHNSDFKVDQFCYANGPSTCMAVNRASTRLFQSALTYCVTLAWKLGFRQIELTPHVNDANGPLWRNLLKMDPFQKVQGISYYDFLIAPMIAAANALPSRATVMFNMQGEMNGALLVYPGSWLRLGSTIRSKLKASNKKVGVNLNFNKMCPWCPEPNYTPYSGQFDNRQIQALFRSLDYVATSAYHPMWFSGDSYPHVDQSRMLSSLYGLNGELKFFGVDLLTLGKPLQYAEFGLGGATCQVWNNCPAQSAYDVAKYPFFGISTGYNSGLFDPWKNSDNTNFRRDFYRTLIQWAAAYDTQPFKVSHVFLWNHGSWDVQGVYLDSSNKAGSWRDPTISGWIQAWNTRGAIP